MKIILASASPRRREILSGIVSDFEVIPSTFDENTECENPETLVKRLAEGKARSVFKDNPDCIVIGADTVVFFEGEVLGKPEDRADAIRTLKRLSGKTHEVYTGVCILSPHADSVFAVRSEVEFNVLTSKFIEEYVDGGSPMDKAGSYGIQDGGVVKEYRGSYTNIVGLPEEELASQLKKFI